MSIKQPGGPVNNSAGQTISGYGYGIWIYGGTGTVTNAGVISATGTYSHGVTFGAGGTVTNTGIITASGYDAGGIVMIAGAGAATNAGTISATGTHSEGVKLKGGGTVTNQAGGTISGAGGSVYILGGTGTVINAGSLVGGVWLQTYGTVANQTGGTINGGNANGGYGVGLHAGGTVTNAGKISGLYLGVEVDAGGAVTNQAGGTISGPYVGVLMGFTTGGGNLINDSGATISGESGVIAGIKPATVANAGLITGTTAVTVAKNGITLALGAGVSMDAGGAVTNQTGGTITGADDGVYMTSGSGTVSNAGTIRGGNVAIKLQFGGTVTNSAEGTIGGGAVDGELGVHISGGAGTVINAGAIAGTFDGGGVELATGGTVTNGVSASISGYYFGVSLNRGGGVTNAGTISGSNVGVGLGTGPDGAIAGGGGGTVNNQAGGIITGEDGGVFALAAAATVINAGAIAGTNAVTINGIVLGDGVGMGAGGTVVNESGGTITGANDGVYLTGGPCTVTNVGTISGTVDSVAFAGSGPNTLTLQTGSVLIGDAIGSTASGATDALVLQGSGATNNNFVNFDTLDVLASGAWTLGGVSTIGATTVSDGTLTVTGTLTSTFTINGASTLEFTSTFVGAATFSGSPTGSGGTLKLDAPSTGPITVVNSNDTVVAQPGSNNWINAAVSYTLPANIDTLFLFAGAQGSGNSDAAGNALYALDTVNTQTLTGNSANDAFVVFNSSDVVVPKAGSHDVVYAAASYTLPTGVDTLFLEGTAAQGTGNSDAAGDAFYAANAGQVATLTGNSANDVFVVYNSADVVVPKASSHDLVYSAVNYTLPTGVDVLLLEAGTRGVGNSDASGDALYAADAGIAQTLTGNSANDAFVVYNSADVVVPKAGSHDTVYAAVNYTLPTGVDTLFLEAGTQGAGNSDAAGDLLYAADAGIGQTLTGHSHNDTFVVYNSADAVAGQASSTDTVYAAASFTLPTNVDTLFLEGNASHGSGNGDAVDALFGNSGVASTLVAGSGADTLYVTGTAGTIMTGGAGHDTFAFPNAMGHDEVTNFGTAKDTLQFNATLFANFTAAMNAASQVGPNTVFTIDANDTVTLDNVTKTSLTAGNFHFT